MVLSEEIEAYVLVIVSIGMEHDVREKIKSMRGVEEVRVTYGSWDMIVKIKVQSMQELDKVVTAIRRIDGIEHTETLICT